MIYYPGLPPVGDADGALAAGWVATLDSSAAIRVCNVATTFSDSGPAM